MAPNDRQHGLDRRGVVAAIAAYGFWGVAPIYFKWIQSVAPLEVIAHRILWSIPLLMGFLWLRDGSQFWQRIRLPMRSIMMLLLTGSLVACNWLIFVWAVVHDQVLSTSLGYFIGPLVSFLLGFLFLHERLSRVQIIGVIIAASGTLYLAWFLQAAPWISLGVACSFGLYGLFRKTLPVGPTVGLLWEAILLATPALIFMRWSMLHGTLSFASGDLNLDLLLALAGLVTILPLIWFNLAARTLSLTTLGFFQYIGPSISFILAVFLFGETFTFGHAVAFSAIWLALVLVSIESYAKFRSRIPV